MNNLKLVVLLALLTGLLITAGKAFGGTGGMMLMFVVSMGINFFSYWYSDKIVLKMYDAREVDIHTAPELVGMVANLARRAGMRSSRKRSAAPRSRPPRACRRCGNVLADAGLDAAGTGRGHGARTGSCEESRYPDQHFGRVAGRRDQHAGQYGAVGGDLRRGARQ